MALFVVSRRDSSGAKVGIPIEYCRASRCSETNSYLRTSPPKFGNVGQSLSNHFRSCQSLDFQLPGARRSTSPLPRSTPSAASSRAGLLHFCCVPAGAAIFSTGSSRPPPAPFRQNVHYNCRVSENGIGPGHQPDARSGRSRPPPTSFAAGLPGKL